MVQKSDIASGSGHLADVIVDPIQIYYGYAIRNNNRNTKVIKKAIWTIFHHLQHQPKK